MNMTAHHVVAFERTLAAPRGPNAVWLPAPPNAPARSAALPLCRSTTTISTKQLTTKKVGNTQKNQQCDGPLHPTRHFNTSRLNPKMPGQSPASYSYKVDDRRERLRVEARSADKRPVQFFLRHQSLNVVRLDAAAIENPEGRGEMNGEILARGSP